MATTIPMAVPIEQILIATEVVQMRNRRRKIQVYRLLQELRGGVWPPTNKTVFVQELEHRLSEIIGSDAYLNDTTSLRSGTSWTHLQTIVKQFVNYPSSYDPGDGIP